MKKLFSIQEAARLLGVSTKTLRRWEEKGTLVPQRSPGNQRRYTQEQLDKFQGKEPEIEIAPEPQPQIAPEQASPQAHPTSEFWINETVKTIVIFRKMAFGAIFIFVFLAICALAFAAIKSTDQVKSIDIPKLLGVAGLNLTKEAKVAEPTYDGREVLGAQSDPSRLLFGLNIPAQFQESLRVEKIATLAGGVVTENQDVNAGTGRLTASNVIYDLIAGQGIAISDGQTPTVSSTSVLSLAAGTGITVGTGQNPSITNTGVTSLNDKVGDLDITAGSGISLSGLEIANSDKGSSQNIFKTIGVTGSNTITASSNTDTLTFEAGSGITLTSNSTTKTINIAGASGSVNHWDLNNGAVYPINPTVDLLVGGSTTASADFAFINVNSGTPTFQISGNSVLTSTTLGSTVVNSSLNSVGALSSGSIITGFSTITTANTITGSVLNATTGINTGAGAGTQRINSSGNLVNIGTTQFNTVTYTWPGADAASAGYALTSNAAGTLSWSPITGGINWWNQANGAIYPFNSTVDLLIGSNATATAKFAVLNVSDSNFSPTASLSSNLAGRSTFLSGAGELGTTNANILTIGGKYTGDVQIQPNTDTQNYFRFQSDATNLTLSTTDGSNLSITPAGALTLNSTGSNTITLNSGNDVITFDSSDTTLTASGLGTITSAAALAISATTLNLGNGAAATIGTISDDNLTITPNGSGELTLTSDFNTPVNVGTSSNVPAVLSVSGGFGANAAVIIDQLNSADIFTASASGTTRFTIANDGDITLNGGDTITASSLATLTSSATLGISAATLNLGNGAAATIGTVSDDDLSLSPNGTGDIRLVTDAGTDIILPGFNANNNILYATVSTGVLTGASTDSTGLCLLSGASAPAWGSCSSGVAQSNWRIGSGAISPVNETLDLLIGGTSTPAAKFAVLNVNGSATPVASVSATTASGGAGTGLSLSGGGTIQSLNMGTLTLGGSTTGNIVLDSGSSSITLSDNTTISQNLTIGGTTGITFSTTGGINLAGGTLSDSTDGVDIADALEVSGLITANGGLTVPSGQTTTFAGLTGNNSVLYSTASTGVLAAATTSTADLCLISQGSNAPGWGSCSAGQSSDFFWNQTSGALHPNNSTVDLLIGGTSTAAAKFAVLNVNSGTPTASISANSGNNATFLTGLGNLGATNGQTLTLGGASTGDILIQPNQDTGDYFRFQSDATNLTLSTTDGSNLTITPAGALTLNSTGSNTITLNSGNDVITFDSSDTTLTASGLATLTSAATLGISATTLNLGNGAAATIGTISDDNLSLSPNGTGDIILANDAGTDIIFPGFNANNNILYATVTTGVVAGASTDTTGLCLLSGSSAPAWGSCATGVNQSNWKISSGALSPINETLDLLLGSNATASAEFAVIGINNGTPIASISATTNGLGLSLTGATGTIQSLNMGTLTLGGSTTGNIVLDSGSSSITLSDNTTISQNLTISGTTGLTFSTTGGINLAGGTISDTTDGVDIADALEVSGLITANGGLLVPSGQSTTLQSFGANGGVVYANASGVLAQTLAAADSSQCLLGGAIPSWGSCNSGETLDVFWNQTSGALHPNNSTVDLLIGGQSTAAAKFAVLNINSGTPTASLSAGTAGGAYLTAAGTLSTTAKQSLVLGSSTTGDISFVPGGVQSMFLSSITGRVGVGTQTAPKGLLDIAGTAGQNAALIVNQTGTNVLDDIFTASRSGTPVFTITNNGSIVATSSATTTNAFSLVDNVLTTGNGFLVSSNSTSSANTNPIYTSADLIKAQHTFNYSDGGQTLSGNVLDLERNLTSNIVLQYAGLGGNITDTDASLTGTVTTQTGANRLLVVAIEQITTSTGTDTIQSVDYGGQTGNNQCEGVNTNNARVAIWYFTEAQIQAASNTTLTVTLDADNATSVIIASSQWYRNVNQSTPTGSCSTEVTGTGTSITGNTITASLGEIAIDVQAHNGSASNTAASGQAVRQSNTSSGAVGESRPSGNTSHNWTLGSSRPFVEIGVAIKPSNTLTVTGALANLTNTCTQTNGTCSDSSNILLLTQNHSGATGDVLKVSNAGSGPGISVYSTGTGEGFHFTHNGTGIINDGLEITNSGGGTLANGINISNGLGTFTDGIELSGTFTNYFNSTNFIVNGSGRIQANFDTLNSERLCWDASGISFITDCTGTPGDYAEDYGSTEDSLEAGDLVVADPEKNGEVVINEGEEGSKAWVLKSAKKYEPGLIGIVSTNPNEVIGQNFDPEENPVAVALNGRVPVKVTTENGSIKPGDPLTSSTKPGVAMKATEPGVIIGVAMDSYDNPDPDNIEKIIAFVNLSWRDPRVQIMADGSITNPYKQFTDEQASQILGLISTPEEPEGPEPETDDSQPTTNNENATSSGTFDLAGDQSFLDLKDRVSTVESKISDLQNQIINSSTQSAFLASIMGASESSGASDSAGFADGEDLDIGSAIISGDLSVLGRTRVEDLGVTGNIAAGLLSIHGLDPDVNGGDGGATINSIGDLNLQNNGLGGINILSGKVLIDKLGNLKTEGEITAKKVKIDTSESSSKTLGSATLEAGETGIDIDTTAVTNKSKVLVTATSKTGNQVLVVTQKTSGQGFRVEIEDPYGQNIKFDWWIVDEAN